MVRFDWPLAAKSRHSLMTGLWPATEPQHAINHFDVLCNRFMAVVAVSLRENCYILWVRLRR